MIFEKTAIGYRVTNEGNATLGFINEVRDGYKITSYRVDGTSQYHRVGSAKEAKAKAKEVCVIPFSGIK